eukprot:scaffold317526_cov12-Tisochrysis_lutea.AAC.1
MTNSNAPSFLAPSTSGETSLNRPSFSGPGMSVEATGDAAGAVQAWASGEPTGASSCGVKTN